MTGERVHHLKCWPEYFAPLTEGIKTAELRRDDRDYREGDLLILQEWNPETQEYTGRCEWREITHIVRGGPWLVDGYAMLSVLPISDYRKE